MPHLKPTELKIIKQILQQIIPSKQVWAFGSRVTGKNLKPYSDLDLAIIDSLPLALRSELTEAFAKSDLPFRVDVVDWESCDEGFQNIIRDAYQVIQ